MESKPLELQRFSKNAAVDDIVNALRRDGAAVVENLVGEGIVDNLKGDLREPFDTLGRETENDFNGYKTLRINSVLELSRASAELIGHAKAMAVMDEILLEYCKSYRIGSCTAIEIHPGEKDQVLHRDDSIYPVRMPGLEMQMSVMWALDDFTIENGATRIVPGSHRWIEPRDVREGDEIVQAPMSKGSALFYLGSTQHGGGGNNSAETRAGLVNTYALGWLRQEVNQYLSIPQDVVLSYPRHIQQLIGYAGHGDDLGWYPNPEGEGWLPGYSET